MEGARGQKEPLLLLLHLLHLLHLHCAEPGAWDRGCVSAPDAVQLHPKKWCGGVRVFVVDGRRSAVGLACRAAFAHEARAARCSHDTCGAGVGCTAGLLLPLAL